MTWRYCRVYVVEQDLASLHHTAHLLRSRDFTVELRPSPPDFLAEVEALTSGCIVIDLLSPALDFDVTARRLRSVAGRLPFVTLTDSACQNAAVEAMRTGAIDFLRKPADPDRLVAAIRHGCARAAEACEDDAKRKQLIDRLALLTGREQEVFAGLALGRSNKGIARDLGISDRTVEVHRASLMQKLDAASFADALRLAFEIERLLPGALPTFAVGDWHDPPGHAKMAQT